MASKDPKSGPGRLWGTARLSAHFIQEEFADMQDGFPRPAEIASGLLDALHAGAERVGKRLGLLPEGSHDDVGERLFHAAALGLIAGTIVVGLFISTFAGVEALKSSERLALVELTVHGLERTGRADLDRALEIAVGDNLLEFEPEVVALRGTELPWVDELQIERNLRTQVLKVRVVEHRPALLLASGDGMHLVDDKGAVFKPLEQGDPSDFPVLILEGSADPAVLSEASSGALEVLHALAAGRSVSRSDVSELRFDPADGFLLVTRRGLPIRLGRRDLADRLGRLERAVEVGDLPLDALASVDIGLRDRLVAVPLSTRTARKRIEDRVKKQPVQTSERRRMLHLDRIRQSLGDAGEAEL